MAFLNEAGLSHFKDKIQAEIDQKKDFQSAVPSPATAAESTSEFIDTVSQDANGVITATKKHVYGTDVPMSEDNAESVGNSVQAIKDWKPTSSGTAGQVLKSKGDGTTEWGAAASQADVNTAVNAYMSSHMSPNQTIALDDSLTSTSSAAQAAAAGNQVLVTDSTPSATTNKVWIKKTPEEEITIPTMDDHNDLKSAFDNTGTFFGNGVMLSPKWNYGYVKATDLTIVNSGTTHVYSDPVLIPAGYMLYFPRVNKSSTVSCLTLCDSTGTPQQVLVPGVSSSQSTHEHILYPFFEDTYVRLSGNMTESDYMQYYIRKITDDITFDEDTFALFNSLKTLSYTNGRIMTPSGLVTIAGTITSDKICLPKGMTLEYWGCGSGVTGAITVTDFPSVGSPTTPIQAAVDGGSTIQHGEYTAEKHMYVRLSARIAPMEGEDYLDILPETNFKNWRIYYKGTHYPESIRNSILYGKHLTVMGDSLIHGNALGTGATWITALGLKYNMTVTNLGINGSPMSSYGANGMVDRLSSIPSDTDFFILEGGANDKNNNVPIGDLESYDKTTFCGALNTIIDYVRQNLPRARFGLLTNWQRYVTLTENGCNEENYVNAMIAVAHNKSVPVFDNYHGCGLTFYNSDLAAWIDEGKDRQRLTNDVVEYYNNGRSVHFSVAAYEWLMPLYEQFLLNMRSTGDSALRKQVQELENYYIKSCADRYTEFESGSIKSDGTEIRSSDYIKSGYLTKQEFIRVDKPTGIVLYPCIYNVENGEPHFVRRLTALGADYTASMDWSVFETYEPSIKYIRFVATVGALNNGLDVWIPGSRN